MLTVLAASLAVVPAVAPAAAAAPALSGIDPAVAALPGTPVTLSGSGFAPTSLVTFGGTPAAYVRFVSEDSLTAVVPDGLSGPVDVTVSTEGALSNPVRFTFLRGAWAETAAMRAPRAGHTATRLEGPSCATASPPAHCGRVLVVGGGWTEVYDPGAAAGSGRWTRAPTPLGACVATPVSFADGHSSANSRRYLSSSARFSPLDVGQPISGEKLLEGTTIDQVVHAAEAILSAPATGTGSSLAFTLQRVPATCPTAGHTATLLADGGVLVVGGTGGDGGVLAGAERYDPASGAWTALETLHSPRAGHTATLLPDGDVLVVGGHGGDGAAISGVERYDDERGWVPVDPLVGCPRPGDCSARTGHSATLLDGTACRGPEAARPGWCGKVLVAGGAVHRAERSEVLASAQLFDPEAAPGRSWEPTAPLDGCADAPSCTARSGHTATSLEDGTVLVTGGTLLRGSADVLDASALYRPGPDASWAPTAALPGARAEHSATRLADGTVLVAGGTRSGPLGGAAVYHPRTATWAAAPSLLEARAGHTATALRDGTVVVAGGHGGATASGLPAELRAAERYDPSRTPSPPVTGLHAVVPAEAPPEGGTVVTLKGAGLFPAESVRFGGIEAPRISFNSLSEVTVVAPPHPPADVDVTVVTSAGGTARTAFTFGAPLWTATGRLGPGCSEASPPPSSPPPGCAGRYLHTATLLPDGDVLVTGGVGAVTQPSPSGETMASAERYRPATGAWRPAPSLDACAPSSSSCTRRAHHTATLLTTGRHAGKVLVAGGSSNLMSAPLGTAQLFDPAADGGAGRWTATGSMSVARYDHTATLLPDGRVLVVGGSTSNVHTPTASVEIYDPENGSWTAVSALDSCPTRPESFPDGATTQGSSQVTSAADRFTRFDVGRAVTGAHIPDGATVVGFGGPRSVTLSVPATGTARPVTLTVARAPAPCAARTNHTATLVPAAGAGGTVLVVAGIGRHPTDVAPTAIVPLATAELYDVATGTWSPTEGLPPGFERYSHTATLLDGAACAGPGPPGACVLVAGGIGAFTGRTAGEVVFLASTALFDTERRRWSPAGNLNTERGGHTATALPGGEVLVVGRKATVDDSTGDPSPTAELYDPAGRTWRYTSSLGQSRGTHTATLLDGPACAATGPPPTTCGAVLVAGGAAGEDEGPYAQPSLPSAEVYFPAPSVLGVAPGTGPSRGGTSVTVTGAGLATARTVRFGGVEGTDVSVVTPTTLTVTAPAHPAGLVPVVVADGAGRAGPRQGGFTYTLSGAPGRVTDLEARAASETDVELSFSAPPADDGGPSPAALFVVKEALAPIANDAAFDAAAVLCDGVCAYSPRHVGERLTLAVGSRAPGTTYHYALRAINAAGAAGPTSNPAAATTLGAPPREPRPPPCPPPRRPGSAQVAYPAGYSLIGLPGGTSVGTRFTLFGWFDRGAGGTYSRQAALGPVAAGHGYWAWFPCPHVVDLAAGGPTSVTVRLGAHRASIVGNPSPSPAVVSGHDYAARWDPGLNGGAGGYRLSGYREASTLAPGEGIWVFSYRDTTLSITPPAPGGRTNR